MKTYFTTAALGITLLIATQRPPFQSSVHLMCRIMADRKSLNACYHSSSTVLPFPFLCSLKFLKSNATKKIKSPTKDNSKSFGFTQGERTTCHFRHKANHPHANVKLCGNEGKPIYRAVNGTDTIKKSNRPLMNSEHWDTVLREPIKQHRRVTAFMCIIHS